MATKAQRNISNPINSYTRGDGLYTRRAFEQREKEENVKIAKAWLKGMLIALAIIGVISTTSGCVNDGDVLVKVECSLFPAGQQPPSCN